MNRILNFILENKLLAAVIAGTGLFLIIVWARQQPSIGDFVDALGATQAKIETYSGPELQEMNKLVNSGKSGALVFTILARAVIYAGGVLSPQEAERRAKIAVKEMTTVKVNGVMVSVWRYAFGWQARMTLALEQKIHAKDMAGSKGTFCAEAGRENRITCSKFESFVKDNYFITISAIKEKVVLHNGGVVDCVQYDDATVRSVRQIIEDLKV